MYGRAQTIINCGRTPPSDGICAWTNAAPRRNRVRFGPRASAAPGKRDFTHTAGTAAHAHRRRRCAAPHGRCFLRLDADMPGAHARASVGVGAPDGGDWGADDADRQSRGALVGRLAACNWSRRACCIGESKAPASCKLSNCARSRSAARTELATSARLSPLIAANCLRFAPLKAASNRAPASAACELRSTREPIPSGMRTLSCRDVPTCNGVGNVAQAALRLAGTTGLFRVHAQTQQLGREILTRLRGKHAILDAPRQNHRPLVDRLIRHADSLSGCGRCPSEQFYGR